MLTNDERTTAETIWEEFQSVHDLSERNGEIAGIDPHSGKVWIGEWFDDVIAQRDADGIDRPLLFQRIGSPTVLRKLRKGSIP